MSQAYPGPLKGQRGARRQVVIFLSRDEWRQLSALAVAAERDPYQQARWLVVRALRESETPPTGLDTEPERAELAV